MVGRAFHSHVVSVDRGSNGTGLTTGARYRQVGSQGGTFFPSGRGRLGEGQPCTQFFRLHGVAGPVYVDHGLARVRARREVIDPAVAVPDSDARSASRYNRVSPLR